MRECWWGLARIANTTAGGASTLMLSETTVSLIGRPYATGPGPPAGSHRERASGGGQEGPLSAADRRQAQRHARQAALADGEPLGDLLQRLRGGRLRLG